MMVIYQKTDDSFDLLCDLLGFGSYEKYKWSVRFWFDDDINN